jgi:transposase
MVKSHPPYPEEFRREAVRLARSSGKSVPEVAKDLGVSDQALRNWVRQADIDGGKRDGLTSPEREQLQKENARLRRENKTLVEEREILKKAAVFFATETNGAR